MEHQSQPTGFSPHRPHRAAGRKVEVTSQEHERHEQAVAAYPQLRLSAGEYVIDAVRRHPIGIVSIWAVAGIIMLLILGVVPMYSLNQAVVAQLFLVPVEQLPLPSVIMTPVMIMVGFVALGGAIATIVYNGNRFYLTNESVIQFVQYSLFNTRQQTVNLINIEDASATQNGILEQLLNYGTLRLSTQGEETIYHFKFTANPKRVANQVNDAMESAVRRLEGVPYPPSEF